MSLQRAEKKEYLNIVMINGGLGSQMAKYAFYLLLTNKCTDKRNMIDTYFYRCNNAWNGYELNKIFGISAPDFSQMHVDDSEEKKDYFTHALEILKRIDPKTEVIRVSRGEYTYYNSIMGKYKKVLDKIWFKLRYEAVLHFDKNAGKYGYYRDKYKKNIYKLKANVYFDEFNYTSDEYFREIRDKLLKVYTFPVFEDHANISCKTKMLSTESVVMHIRRSDHMYDNAFLFKGKYYVKAVRYIKERVSNPVFFIFSDECQWCRNNRTEIGLEEKDDVVFVDWNKSEESFRDMQLMTYGKHNILAISSFSWWGYFLSRCENKIVCAPKGYWLEVDNHF